ncbi:nucleoside deaminase [bacterium]|nr:nucleoside deaminase [bacterium]
MDKKFMLKALETAKESGEDVPVGCVIVKDNEIIAFAHNEREKNKKISAHAEILAIEKAEQILGSWKLDGCEMYVTLEPCPMCAGAIVQSGIKTVYFGAYDTVYGAFGSKTDMRTLMNSKTLKVFGGIEEEKCKEVITKFFEEMRKNG